MSKIYLKAMPDGSVRAFGDMESVNAPLEVDGGAGKYDTTVTVEQWEQAGNHAYVDGDGSIVLGWPEEEIRARQEGAVRLERNKRLRKIDKLNPLFWEDLTEEQMQALREYRRALLDVPQQEGFPWDGDLNAVPWPEKPSFLF